MDITGRTLSHYRLVEKLGEGASGLVYLAEDLVLGRPVVLKRLPHDAGEMARQRALVEARTIAALNHPNICTLYEYAEAEGEWFLVLEVLEGQTLEGLIAQGPLPLAQVIELGVQLADALDAAHTHGIVHRDIKPPNVFVTLRGQAKILDFGIATLSTPGGPSNGITGDTSPGSGALYGTLHYIAPEQIRGEIVDGRADLFSLGALLYEMASGVRAFDGTDPPDVAAAILSGAPQPLRSLRPEVPAELERIVGSALEKDPALRCQSAADLRADLQRLKRQLEVGTIEPAARTEAGASPDMSPSAAAEAPADRVAASMAGPTIRGRRIGLPSIAAAALVIAAGVGLPAWLLRSHPPEAIVRTPPPAPSATPPLPSLTPSAAAPPTPIVWLDPPSDQDEAPAPVPVARATGATRTGTTSAAPAEPSYESELRAARAALAARRFDESISILRDVAVKAGDTTPGIDAQIVLAHVQGRQLQVDEAVAAYAAVVARYPAHPKAAEAMYYQAQAILGTNRADRDSEARKLLTEIADRFSGHAFVPRALLARGEIEARRQTYQFDSVLGRPVPASLVTYRTLVAIPSGGREREHALWRLGLDYERVERFDLAAQTYRRLGEDYARTHYDAWASAARLYDRRLNDPVLARAAYLRVPSTSPAFKDAQKYVRSAS